MPSHRKLLGQRCHNLVLPAWASRPPRPIGTGADALDSGFQYEKRGLIIRSSHESAAARAALHSSPKAGGAKAGFLVDGRGGTYAPGGGSIPQHRYRILTGVALVILLIAAFLIVLWRHGQFDWTLFASTLLAVRVGWLAAAVAVALATYYGRALRWAVLIRHLRPHPNIWGLFSATVIGFTAIVLLGRPGELVRPYLIASKEKLPFSSQLAAWFLERICDLLCALLIFGFALAQIAGAGTKVGARLQWVLGAGGYMAGALGLTSLLVVVLLRQFSTQLRRRVLDGLAFLPDRLQAKAVELFDAFLLGIEATRTRAGLVGIVAYTVLEWGLIILCFVALGKCFPAMDSLTPADILILMGFVAFGSLVQIPGIGGGVQVVSVVAVVENNKIPLETAKGIALIIWLITFVVVVPVGLALLVHEGMSWRKIKEIEKTART